MSRSNAEYVHVASTHENHGATLLLEVMSDDDSRSDSDDGQDSSAEAGNWLSHSH